MQHTTNTTLPFAQYGQRTGGMMGDLVTYASWAVAVACAAEGYYIFQHSKDLLAGFGLVQTNHDVISLFKFYGITGVVAFSIATQRYLKVTAVGLAGLALAGMYGTTFHINGANTFNTAKLPTVTIPTLGAANASSRDVPDAAAATTGTTPAKGGNLTKLYASAKAAGYAVGRPLNADEKAWCGQGENAVLNMSARFNCGTGYRWNPPANTTTVATKVAAK